MKNTFVNVCICALLMPALGFAMEKQIRIDSKIQRKLEHAIESGDRGFANHILKFNRANIDVNGVSGQYNKPLLITAIEKGNPIIVADLISAGADINKSDALQKTPIIYAIAADNGDIIRMLLSAGVDPNKKVQGTLLSGYTPLMIAARDGKVNSVRILLEAGANPYLEEIAAFGRKGKNAFDFAINPEVIQLLEMYKKEKLP